MVVVGDEVIVVGGIVVVGEEVIVVGDVVVDEKHDWHERPDGPGCPSDLGPHRSRQLSTRVVPPVHRRGGGYGPGDVA